MNKVKTFHQPNQQKTEVLSQTHQQEIEAFKQANQRHFIVSWCVLGAVLITDLVSLVLGMK